MKGFLLNVKKFLTLDISPKKDNNKVKKNSIFDAEKLINYIKTKGIKEADLLLSGS